VQDEITEAVTIAIAPAIADAEQQRALRKPPGSLDAWAAYQRGLWHLEKATLDDNVLAQKLFQRAVDADPNFADGYCGLAMAQMHAVGVLQTRGLADLRSSAEPLARLAVALDGNNALAHACLSNVLLMAGDHLGGLAEAERALAMCPNLAFGYWRKGLALIRLGRPREGLEDLQRSLRLEPRGSNLVLRLTHVAAGHYFVRAYEVAAENAQQAIRAFPEHPQPYRWLAAALGQLGRIEEAKKALDKAIATAPGSFDMYLRQLAQLFRPEDYAHMLEGLSKAGWKE